MPTLFDLREERENSDAGERKKQKREELLFPSHQTPRALRAQTRSARASAARDAGGDAIDGTNMDHEEPSTSGAEAGDETRYSLTKPSIPVANDNWDNENSDLILYAGDEIWMNEKQYRVDSILGHGTFGQVVRCICCQTGNHIALKVIKNQPAYFHQARMEIAILQYLNNQYELESKHHIVRMLDFCKFKNHLCIAFELLHDNLYELLKMNHFHGLSLNLVRALVSQILTALIALRDSGVIHCDLKPENILLENPHESAAIKIIDFGSACFSDQTVYSYIQSRFYRSIEVVLGYPYSFSIDMWSLGCIAAELFLGLPLFPGASEYDLLCRIIEMLGQPVDNMLKFSKNTFKYFKMAQASPSGGGGEGRYELMTEDEYEASSNSSHKPGKCYFTKTKLADIIGTYPYRCTGDAASHEKEQKRRDAFLDFLQRLLTLDPHVRWTPRQAMQHPFVTGEDFAGPFQPQPDVPRHFWPTASPAAGVMGSTPGQGVPGTGHRNRAYSGGSCSSGEGPTHFDVNHPMGGVGFVPSQHQQRARMEMIHAQAHAAACQAVVGSHPPAAAANITFPTPFGTPPMVLHFGTPPAVWNSQRRMTYPMPVVTGLSQSYDGQVSHFAMNQNGENNNGGTQHHQ